jgi:predicted metal-dependent hydrolase
MQSVRLLWYKNKKETQSVFIKHIVLLEKEIQYTLILSKRSRHIRITINGGGKVRVTLPYQLRTESADDFIKNKATWILSKIDYFNLHPSPILFKITKKEYTEHKEKAKVLVKEMLEKFNNVYNFNFGNVTIKNQKTLWGSCSRKGNLNFNYKIALIPERCAEYIIVHELCHLKEFNHSAQFWDLVAKTIPEYKQLRKQLRSTTLHMS